MDPGEINANLSVYHHQVHPGTAPPQALVAQATRSHQKPSRASAPADPTKPSSGSYGKKRRQRPVDDEKFGKFVRRILLKYGRRVASGNVDALSDLISLLDLLKEIIKETVSALLKPQSQTAGSLPGAVGGAGKHGYSWADIARRLGVSKQAVQQRWGNKSPAPGTARRDQEAQDLEPTYPERHLQPPVLDRLEGTEGSLQPTRQPGHRHLKKGASNP